MVKVIYKLTRDFAARMTLILPRSETDGGRRVLGMFVVSSLWEGWVNPLEERWFAHVVTVSIRFVTVQHLHACVMEIWISIVRGSLTDPSVRLAKWQVDVYSIVKYAIMQYVWTSFHYTAFIAHDSICVSITCSNTMQDRLDMTRWDKVIQTAWGAKWGRGNGVVRTRVIRVNSAFQVRVSCNEKTLELIFSRRVLNVCCIL